jgi:hypothetical protein
VIAPNLEKLSKVSGVTVEDIAAATEACIKIYGEDFVSQPISAVIALAVWTAGEVIKLRRSQGAGGAADYLARAIAAETELSRVRVALDEALCEVRRLEIENASLGDDDEDA